MKKYIFAHYFSFPQKTLFVQQSADSSTPFFSIIIPVYNAEAFIKECLDSLLIQNFPGWEVLLVDDCSTDGSLEIMRQIAGNDPRFRIMKHDVNKGAAAARNLAIREAKGSWCSFLDSDNQMRINYLQTVYSAVSVLSDKYGIFWTGCRRIHHYKDGLVKEEDAVFTIPANKPFGKIDFLKNLRVGTGTGLSVKRKYLLQAGLFDESLKAAEDTDLMYRLIQTCDFTCSKEVLFNYHIYHDKTDRLTTNYRSQFSAYKVIVDKNAALLQKESGLRHRAFSKLIRYAIFSRQPRLNYVKYVNDFISHFGRFNKLVALYYLSALPGGGIFVSLYKRLSGIKK